MAKLLASNLFFDNTVALLTNKCTFHFYLCLFIVIHLLLEFSRKSTVRDCTTFAIKRMAMFYINYIKGY